MVPKLEGGSAVGQDELDPQGVVALEPPSGDVPLGELRRQVGASLARREWWS
jgi:hypothetical protein